MDQEDAKEKEHIENNQIEEDMVPSFKDEIRAVGHFFKKLFVRKNSSPAEMNPIANSEIGIEMDPNNSMLRVSGEQDENQDLVSSEIPITIDLKEEVTEDNPEKHEKRRWFSKKQRKMLTEEQIIERKARLYKSLATTFIFLVVFFSVGMFGFTSTTKKEFCKSCHEMKPEYFTLYASSHSDVECIDCHTKLDIGAMAKEKLQSLNFLAKRSPNKVDNPIMLRKQVPDEVCNKCHNMERRAVTLSSDLIIPHQKHAENKVSCIECHAGAIHGQISERNLTKKSKLGNWSITAGTSVMGDIKYTKISMDNCMNCHEAREVTRECTACHSTGMIPESHKNADFKTKSHGKMALEDIAACNECHKYMTTAEVLNQEDEKKIASISTTDVTKMRLSIYTTQNEYCRDCHSKEPPSHQVANFFAKHGKISNSSDMYCNACHPENLTGSIYYPNTTPSCASCHPPAHPKDLSKISHYLSPISNDTKIVDDCYRCHVRDKCQRCHLSPKEQKKRKSS